jgi:hypothetical protein
MRQFRITLISPPLSLGRHLATRGLPVLSGQRHDAITAMISLSDLEMFY